MSHLNDQFLQQDESMQVDQNDLHVDIKRIESFTLEAADQNQSSFFTDLPGEVRDIIYEYVLADFENMEKPYDIHTCFRRPEYYAPRKTDTALLRTCQEVYAEAWYLPWTSARHTFYLTQPVRKPTKTTSVEQMTNQLALIEKLHPDTPSRRKEIRQVQIFAQACNLEPYGDLRKILEVPLLLPQTVTITLRHTDMWFWESDTPIHLRTGWTCKAQFPASVTRVEMQFESLERRKAQIDYMADCTIKEWYFKRVDSVHLVARSTPETIVWTGSSTWENQRWIRDEDDNLPGKLQYYMATVVFVPVPEKDDEVGYEKRKASGYSCRNINIPEEIAKQNMRQVNQAYFRTHMLEHLGVTDDTPASEVNRLVSEERERKRRAIPRFRCGTSLLTSRRQAPPPPAPPLPVPVLPTGEPYDDSAPPQGQQ